jgi:hypothetical protein
MRGRPRIRCYFLISEEQVSRRKEFDPNDGLKEGDLVELRLCKKPL